MNKQCLCQTVRCSRFPCAPGTIAWCVWALWAKAPSAITCCPWPGEKTFLTWSRVAQTVLPSYHLHTSFACRSPACLVGDCWQHAFISARERTDKLGWWPNWAVLPWRWCSAPCLWLCGPGGCAKAVLLNLARGLLLLRMFSGKSLPKIASSLLLTISSSWRDSAPKDSIRVFSEVVL